MAITTLQNIKAPRDVFTKIYNSIKAQPERYHQGWWHRKIGEGDLFQNNSNYVAEVKSCNTAHCFAGWGQVHTRGGVALEARLALDHYGPIPSEIFNRALVNAGRKPVPEEYFEGHADKASVIKYIQRRAAAEARNA